MLKKSSRFFLLTVLAAGLAISVAPMLSAPASAGFCAPICATGPCPAANLHAVTWVGPACTGAEPRCNPVCIGPGV